MNVSLKERQEVNPTEVSKQNRFYEKFFREQFDLLCKNLSISIPSSLLCATIVFVALYRIPHTYLLIDWFLAFICISVVRLSFAGLYFYDHKSSKLRFYIFLFTTALSAALWGFAGSVLMPANQLIEQMIIIVIIAGVTAGGVQSLQPSLLVCLLYTTLVSVPLSIWVFSQNNVAYTILGISIVIYFLFTLAITGRGYRFLKQTLRLKYENLDLANNVSNKNNQLQQMNQELVEKESNLRLIHDNAPIGMAIVALDGRWINVNNKLCEIVGYSKDELENLTIQDITFQEDLEIDTDRREKLLSGKLPSYQMEKRYVNKEEQLIWILTNVSLVRGKGNKPLYYISQIQDINDRKQNEIIISGLSNMNAMLQLCHNSTEAYPIITHAAQEIFHGLNGGFTIFNKLTSEQETVGQWGDNPLLKLFFKSEDCWAFRAGNIYIANNPKVDSICHHYTVPPAGGCICVPLIVQSQVLGMLNFNATAGHTITHHQEQIINNFSEIIKLSLANIHLNEALSEQAIHDALTGLVNRRYLYERLPQLLQHAARKKHILCVCMLDLDFFKRINDVYGHDTGDEVIKCLGALLKTNIRESDIACRFGGEEFVVVLIDSDLQHATLQMERIRKEVKKAQIYAKNQLIPPITLSIGIAEAPQHGETVSDILRVADLALYAAKEAGRDQVVNASSQVKE